MTTMHGTTARRVGDVMTRAVVTAHEGAPVKEIVAALARNRISTVPVVDEERHVVGVVTASDLLTRIAGDRGEPPRGHRLTTHRENLRKARAGIAADVMTSPAVTTVEDASIDQAARHAAYHHVRSMPVIDRDQVLIGMVTRSDLLKIYLRPDDDIRREIEVEIVQNELVLDPTLVDVAVTEGIVTLTGRLDTRGEVEGLVTGAYHVPGVIDVVDELTYGTG